MDKETEAQIVKAAFEGLLGVNGKSRIGTNLSPRPPPLMHQSRGLPAGRIQEACLRTALPTLPASSAPVVGEPTAPRGGDNWLFLAWYLRTGQGVGCGLARGLCAPKRVWPLAVET